MSLADAVRTLAPLYPAPHVPDDPVALLVWENIGYLMDDLRRAALFDEFRARIGFRASSIANAPMDVLADLAARGGMHPKTRAERLRLIGEIAIRECDGNLTAHLKSLPEKQQRKLLKLFPAIGDPGADKILLFTGLAAVPALDSNGVRAVVRMGYCREAKSYAQTYRASVQALAATGPASAEWYKSAYLTLRAHGRTLCKRTAPICEPCPLERRCARVPTTDL